jgi:integrase
MLSRHPQYDDASAGGLRVGELLGLKWEDVDFKKSVIYIRRSIVKQRIGPRRNGDIL